MARRLPVIALIAAFVALMFGSGALVAAPRFDVFEFENPELEKRYQALIAELRCPKCLNTNLAGSDAPIAQDLRRTVHRLLIEEDMSDAEIRAWLQERYGDFVLYDPPFRPDTWVLWLAPAGFLIAGFLVLARLLRQPAAEPLSDSESARLRDLLERD
jgi:cytochrome c-type biogenesis protein CcmH